MSRTLGPACFLVVMSGTLRAHETDQYSVPTGREFADLRFWYSEYLYDVLEGAVESTNRKIRRSLRNGAPTAQTARLQSPDALASAVLYQFAPVISHVEAIEGRLKSRKLQERYPGLVVSYLPAQWIYHHPLLLLDVTRITRLKRASTLMINGTYLGTDKIVHFAHMGYLYFKAYRQALARGESEEEAVKRAVNMGAGSNFLSENNLLGFFATGVVSNGDKAADYVGMKFYLNLTGPVRLKGSMQPPLLVREGEFFRLNSHVRRDRDFASIFVSDHWNEVLNPNTYAPGIAGLVQQEIRKRCPDVVRWYRNQRGEPYSRDDYLRITRELTTYYGEDYGHEGDINEMVGVITTCFEDGNNAFAATVLAESTQGRASLRGGGSGRDGLGRTNLWHAARSGNVAQMEAAGGGQLDQADIDGETPLHAAVRSGSVEAVRTLLHWGADPGAGNVHRLTPLHLAVQDGQEPIVETLLDAGARADIADSFGRTPLHDGASRGSVRIVSRLLRAAANAQSADQSGTTPLHLAARGGHAEVVQTLLAAGANPQIRNRFGKTPLEEADRHPDAERMLSASRGTRERGHGGGAAAGAQGVQLGNGE